MGRTPYCSSDGLRKGAWTAEEDHKLVSYIQKHGQGGWRYLPQKAGLRRCGKSCRLRWANYLRPGIKRGDFTAEEDQAIFQLHADQLGNKWAAIARHLPKRTDNEIKNYWNAHLKKRLASGSASSSGNSDGNAVAATDPMTDTERGKPQQFEQFTTQRSPSALLLNKLATRVTQWVGSPLIRGSQTLQPIPFNGDGGSENSGIFCHPLSRCTVPESSAYSEANILTDSPTVPEESGYGIDEGDEQSAGVLNDIMASEFDSMSWVDELIDWQNNNSSSSIGAGQIDQVDNYNDSTVVHGYGGL